MNINSTDLGREDHSMFQLCQTLYEKGANLICLTEYLFLRNHTYLVDSNRLSKILERKRK